MWWECAPLIQLSLCFPGCSDWLMYPYDDATGVLTHELYMDWPQTPIMPKNN